MQAGNICVSAGNTKSIKLVHFSSVYLYHIPNRIYFPTIFILPVFYPCRDVNTYNEEIVNCNRLNKNSLSKLSNYFLPLQQADDNAVL